MNASRLISPCFLAIVGLCAAIVAAAPLPAQQRQPAQSPPPVVITPATAQLGKIKPNSTTESTFTLTNKGTQPVKVAKTQPNCKCTGISNIVGQTIPPGGSIEMKAALKAPPMPGEKKAQVFITFDGFGPIAATIIGDVEMSIAAKPAQVDLRNPPLTGTIELHSADGKPFRVLSAGGAAPKFVGFDPAKDAPRDKYALTWSLEGVPQLPIWWTIETDRADCPFIPLRVWHESTGARWDQARFQREWYHKDQLLLGGILKPGQPQEFTIELEHYNPAGKGAVVNPAWSNVTGIVTNNPQVDARIVESKHVGDAQEVRIEITPKPTASGLVATMLTLTTATGSGPIPFFARVEAPPNPTAPRP